jgi:hypothetical protein
VVPAGCRQPGELPATAVDLQAVLDTYFENGDLADVRAIGAAYIESFQGDACDLVDDLSVAVRPIAAIDNTALAVQALDQAVVADFEAHRRTSLHGWQLAATEARLCGIVAWLDRGQSHRPARTPERRRSGG